MPTEVVDVDLRSQTGAVAQRTYSDLVVIGRDPDIADPDYNEPRVYDSSASVEGDFGSQSDVYAASEEIEALGADQWWVVMLETTEHSEVLGSSDTESISEGTVSTTPIRGGVGNITVTLDGTELDPVPVTASPPTQPEASEAAINFDTGEVHTGESSSGADQGIEVTYETLSWDAAKPEMTAGDFDLAVLADTHADRSYIGELDDLVQWGETEDVSMVVAYDNGDNYADDQEALNAAHDIGAYVPSGNVLPIAHKASDDVASAVCGRLATKEPWFNPYLDGSADYTFSMSQYRRSLIGGPEQPGTFEGGNADGEGPTNVLHTEMGVQILSNSISTAGESSNYQFFDVSRTESFIVRETKLALRSLRLRRDTIPFAPVGKTLIENALRKTLNPYVAASGRALSQQEIRQLRQSLQNGDGSSDSPVPTTRATNSEANVPLSQLEIHVPQYDELSQQARANRSWEGIQITAQLAGNAHTFSVELAVTV